MLKYKNLEQVTSVTFLLQYAIPDLKRDNYQESATNCMCVNIKWMTNCEISRTSARNLSNWRMCKVSVQNKVIKRKLLPCILITGNPCHNLQLRLPLVVTLLWPAVHRRNFIRKTDFCLVVSAVSGCCNLSAYEEREVLWMFSRPDCGSEDTGEGSAVNRGTPNIGTCLYCPQNTMAEGERHRTWQANWYVVAAPMKVSDGVITPLSRNSEDSSPRCSHPWLVIHVTASTGY